MADEQKAQVVLTADNRQYDRAMQSSATATNQLATAVIGLSTGLNTLTQRAGRKIEIVSAAGLAGLTAATVSAAKFDSQMATMQANAVLTGRSLDRMNRDVNNLRGSFSVTTDQAIALQTQLSKMGQTAGIDKMSASMLKLSAVTGESISGLTQGMIGLQRQMGTTGSAYTEKFSSALATASAKAGVAATSVLEFSNSIAPIAKTAGLSTKEVLGFSTAFVKAGQDGGAASTAFVKMLSDINRSVQYGSPELKAYSNLIGVSVKQFKEMPRGEAVIRIFEQIQKQGPAAIKTLERFGLDGVRTYRALQAMGQQGGVRAAMADVNEGFNDQTKYNDAAKKAMDGLNDQLAILGNNLTRVGQAFGSAFVPPLQKTVEVLNTVMKPIASLLEGLGKIPGLAALAGTAMVGMAGMVVRNYAGLTALSLFRAAAGGAGAAGYRTAREGSDAPGWARRAQRRYEAGGGGVFQRWMFGMGRGVGEMRGPVDPNAPTLAQRAGRIAALPVRGLGWFARQNIEELRPKNVWNPMNRSTLLDSATMRAAMGVGWNNVKDTASGAAESAKNAFKSNASNNNLNASANAAAAALNNTTKASATQAGLFRTLTSETSALSMAMGKAAIGAGMMGAEGAARLAPTVGRGLLKAGGAVAGFFGGPVGIALGAGALGFSAWQQNRDEKKTDLQLGQQAEAIDAAGGAYKVALGDAARAVTSFADIVKRNASSIDPNKKETPGVITDEMYKEAKKPGRKFTDDKLAKMTEQQARSYVSSMVLTDEQKVLLGYDLSKRFNKGTAQSILDQQKNLHGSIETEGLFSGMKGREHWYWGTNSDASKTATKQAAATGQANLNDIQGMYGDRAAAQYQIASLNSAGKSIFNGGHTAQNFSAVAAMLGINPEDKESLKEFELLFGKNGSDGQFSAGSMSSAASVLNGAGAKNYNSAFATAARQVLATAGPGADLMGTRWDPSRLISQDAKNPLANIEMGLQSTVRSATPLGNVLLANNEVGQSINKAVGNQGNQNFAQQAILDMTNTTLKATNGNFAQASSELQRFKEAIGDASDPLYQLANAAQQAVSVRQSEAMAYGTRNFRAAQVSDNLSAAMKDAKAARGTDGESDAMARLESGRQAGVQSLTEGKDYFKQLYIQIREMGVAESRAWEDYNQQRKWGDDDFYRSRNREEDNFNRQRSRAEASYERQTARQVRDYTRSRVWAQEAFTRQRKRSEEDYQHQVQLMTEQTAKTVYNAYERINTTRSWDAQNLLGNVQEQAQAMRTQLTNLSQVRGMGVSGDVIKMLGLNESQNAQQLARFTAELMESPELVAQYNKAAKDRLKLAGQLMKDEDNTQWKEMERSFKLSANRAKEDFSISMDQQAIQFKTGLADMRQEYNISMQQQMADYSRARNFQLEDYNRSNERMVIQMNKQFTRMKDDLSRNVADITDDMDTLANKAIAGLTGTAQKQAQNLKNTLDKTAKDVRTTTTSLVADVKNLFANWNGATGVTSGGVDMTGAGAKTVGGGGGRNQTKWAAEGGYIAGWSPHKKADNIPAQLTAGEYVHKVDAVNYYGQAFMDAINNRKIPREEVVHYADGGLVAFGHKLQSMDYQVGEHPLFGGVHPVHTKNSWHYKAGAIDVNHDQGDEKAAINRIIQMARNYGLRTIWQVAGHFDHAHFDIGSGPDMIGPGVPTGPRAMGEDPILGAIRKLKSYKKWEAIRKGNYGLRNVIAPDQLAEVIASSFMSPGSGDSNDGVAKLKGDRGANQALGKRMAAARGWTGPNWDALNWIWMKESGWNQFADNPSSDAYGIPQALPGSKMRSAGENWRTDPATQIRWGLGYIAERYGDPVDAQKFWKAHNWYGDGALFTGGAQKVVGIGERGPEMVLPLDQRGVDYMLAVFKQYTAADAKRVIGTSRGVPTQSCGSTNYYSRVDRSTQISGPITVQSNDPRDMLRKLEAEKRIAALTSPRSATR